MVKPVNETIWSLTICTSWLYLTCYSSKDPLQYTKYTQNTELTAAWHTDTKFWYNSIYYFRGLFFDQFVVKQQGYKGSLQH